jgi:hypothetical protein
METPAAAPPEVSTALPAPPDEARPYRFTGKTDRYNSKTHAVSSRNSPNGGLRYKAACGVAVRTFGGSDHGGVDCPRCLTAIRKAASAPLNRPVRLESPGCAGLPGCGTGLAPESHPMGYGARIEVHDPGCPAAGGAA